MNIPAILAIDEGTTGTRAALVTQDGGVHALKYRPLTVQSPRPGVVEQDANEILQKTIDAVRAVLASAEASGVEIKAVAIATQRATAVLWDTVTGTALVPAMVWQDNRFAAELAALGPEWDERLLASIGRPTGVRSPYLWAARHLQETAEVMAARKAGRLGFGTIESWLLWSLTAEHTYAATSTNATSAGAYVLESHEYETDWITALGFPLDLLPELRQDVDHFGHTNPELLGISVPVLAAMGDQHASTVGLGCLEAGQAMCGHGTGSFVDMLTGRAQPLKPGLYDGTLTMAGWRRNNETIYAVETFTATTGSALDWVCNTLGWFESSRKISELAATATGSNGVTFVPTLTGIRTPVVEAGLRASLTGLSMANTRADVAYAVLEGVAHSVASSVEANEESAGMAVTEIVVGGGLSGSDPLIQMQADLTGIPMRRLPGTEHATLRGVAFMAGSDGLLWDSLHEAVAALGPGDVFEPQIPEAERLARRSHWKERIASELALVNT